jgi:hypothetical protein
LSLSFNKDFLLEKQKSAIFQHQFRSFCKAVSESSLSVPKLQF